MYAPVNRSHRIAAQDPLLFNSMAELPEKIERVLADNGITLHPGGERPS